MASCVITVQLVAVLHGTSEFRLGDNALLMRDNRNEIRRRHAEAAEMTPGEARFAASAEDALHMG